MSFCRFRLLLLSSGMRKLAILLVLLAAAGSCSDGRDNRFRVTVEIDDKELESLVEEALVDAEEALNDLKEIRIEISEGAEDIVVELDEVGRDLEQVKKQIARELKRVHKDLQEVKISIKKDIDDLP